MQDRHRVNDRSAIIASLDGDLTIPEGDWLRLWNSVAGVAHEMWIGVCGAVYENSGPGGNVRRNTLSGVLPGRKVIESIGRTGNPVDTGGRVGLAESRLGTPWAAFYNWQDFASEVANGKRQSYQRDALFGVALVGGML
jgi:hypothetical protein